MALFPESEYIHIGGLNSTADDLLSPWFSSSMMI